MSELRDRIFASYQRQNRLHGVLLELTHRCPCDCGHCLLVREPGDELSGDEIADLLRQLRDEGAFNLGLTGGEPFLREDLDGILAAAARHRFFVSLLTTGVLIGPAEVAMLGRHRVRAVEISLLGACAATHDGVMARPGAFDRTCRAVKLLRAAGIAVTLKATLMRPNYLELKEMVALAERLGARFSASVSVAPRVDGGLQPLTLALDEGQLAELDLSLVSGGLIPDEDFGGGALLTCQAGRTVGGISPEGDVFPCILFRRKLGNVRERPLAEIWREAPVAFLAELRGMTERDAADCLDCVLRPHCRRCPGVAYAETGELGSISPSACACARGLALARGGHDKSGGRP